MIRPGLLVRGGLVCVALCAFFRGWDGEPAPRSVALASALPVRATPPAERTTAVLDDDPVLTPYESAIAGARRFVTTTLGPGGTLAGALEQLGLAPAVRARAVRDLSGEIDPSRLASRTGLTAAIGGDGRVLGVAVRAEAERVVRWAPSADEPIVDVTELPVVTRVTSGGGRVVRSVRQALDGLPWASELTLAFADIFQWDIDLLVDPRRDDEVRLVYEVRLLGAAPVDLPPFGDAPRAEGQPFGPGKIVAASYHGAVASGEAYWIERPDGGGYYDADGAPLRKTFLKSPLNYRRISSRFSNARRHPITRKIVPHHGVDFAAAAGTPVVAAADGRVAATGFEGALGRAVRIRHGADYVTIYGHLQAIARGIRPGVEVRQNDVIGFVGSTGRATGPHLHYTMLHRGRAIDPLAFRNPPLDSLSEEGMSTLAQARHRWEPLLGEDSLLAEAAPRRSGPGA